MEISLGVKLKTKTKNASFHALQQREKNARTTSTVDYFPALVQYQKQVKSWGQKKLIKIDRGQGTDSSRGNARDKDSVRPARTRMEKPEDALAQRHCQLNGSVSLRLCFRRHGTTSTKKLKKGWKIKRSRVFRGFKEETYMVEKEHHSSTRRNSNKHQGGAQLKIRQARFTGLRRLKPQGQIKQGSKRARKYLKIQGQRRRKSKKSRWN